MFKLISLSIVFLIFMGANPANSKLLFYDDCENKWDLTNDWRESNTTRGSNFAEVSFNQARRGSSSYKLYVQPFDIENISATNSGLVLRGLNSPVQIKNFLYNQTYWMGFSVLVPESYSWPNPLYKLDGGSSEWQLLWQFHGTLDPCDVQPLNPNIGGHVANGGYKISISGNSNECIKKPHPRNTSYANINFSRGIWHDVVLNFKFSYTNSGFFKVWIDGKQVVNDSGMNCYNQIKGPYFVLGPYGHMKTGTTIYFDEIRVGDSNSSFSEVSPQIGPLPAGELPPPKLQILKN